MDLLVRKIQDRSTTVPNQNSLFWYIREGRVFFDEGNDSDLKDGKVYNNASSLKDFRGEGFVDGDTYQARFVKEYQSKQRKDLARREESIQPAKVVDGQLSVEVEMQKFTSIEFFKP